MIKKEEKFEDIKDITFIKNLSNYFSDFLSTDFKRGRLPKRSFKNKDSKGIIMCGTGNGVSMVANKYEGVRAGLCWSKEIAELIRKHNNANILSLPARFISIKDALEIVKVFLETDFEEGGRHERRVNKIDK